MPRCAPATLFTRAAAVRRPVYHLPVSSTGTRYEGTHVLLYQVPEVPSTSYQAFVATNDRAMTKDAQVEPGGLLGDRSQESFASLPFRYVHRIHSTGNNSCRPTFTAVVVRINLSLIHI